MFTINKVIIYNSDNCPICLNQLKMPVIAPCGHAYCIECLVEHIKFSSYDTVCCPMCRSSIQDITQCYGVKLEAKESREDCELQKLITQVSSIQKQNRLQQLKKFLISCIIISFGLYFVLF